MLTQQGESCETKKATRDVTYVTVIKRALSSSLRDNLPHGVKEKFMEYIWSVTDTMSRISRRASLAFLYYVTRLKEENEPTPDFSEQKDSYWRKWLLIGLDEYSNEMPSPDVEKYFEEIRGLLGTTINSDGTKRDIPLYFDRIIGHAAIQFKTSLNNMMVVNFMSKIGRLCKHVAHKESLSKTVVFQALRTNKIPKEWDEKEKLRSFIAEARALLHLGENEVLYDDTDIPFTTRVDFHWWMQQKFASLDVKKLHMSPVSKVARSHVRLDATHLFLITWECLKPSPVKPPQIPLPTKSTHPNKKEREDEIRAVKERRADAEQKYRTEVQESLKWKQMYPNLKGLMKNNPGNPRIALNQTHPFPKRVVRGPNEDDESLNKRKNEAKEARDRVAMERREIEKSSKYVEGVLKYEEYEKKIHSFAQTLFKPFKDKNSEKGWRTSCSICTDGVSVSVGYEKTIQVPVSQNRPPSKSKNRTVLPPCDDYNPYQSTLVGDTFVLGVDPGRTTIVTVVCIDNKGKKHSWKLSRGQYYSEAGIFKEDALQRKRYDELIPALASLNDGSLRASSSSEVIAYLRKYVTFQEDWWSQALHKVETRSKYQRYLGKKKSMDKFWAKVYKDARRISGGSRNHPERGKRLEVAHGAAEKSMPSHGRGELSVPVKGAYSSCKQMFGKRNVTLEEETNTTKFSWESKKVKEVVYKRYKPDGTHILDHTSYRVLPFVLECDLIHWEAHARKMREKSKLRKSWRISSEDKKSRNLDEKDSKKRYIECRGLRFCPETRKYYDRDVSSARAIAGLRCLTLKGLGRPTVFRRAKKEELQSDHCVNSMHLVESGIDLDRSEIDAGENHSANAME